MSFVDQVNVSVQELGERAQEWAEEHRDELEGLGQDALDEVLDRLAGGDLDGATRSWIGAGAEEGASADDRLDAMGDAAAELHDAHEREEAIRERLMELGQDAALVLLTVVRGSLA